MRYAHLYNHQIPQRSLGHVVNGHQFLTHFGQIKLTHPLKWLKTERSAKYPPCAWPSAANSPL
jgi:hypothetical protein